MAEKLFLEAITVLPVDDIYKASAWYEKALGLKTVYLHEGKDDGEVTNYAVMVRDGIHVHLILDEPPPHNAPWTKSGTGYLYIKVEDVDAIYLEVKAAGIDITRDLETENWGARGFNLTDPSGNAVHIEQDLRS